MSCFTSLQLSSYEEWNYAIDDTVNIMWCWCQWHHMTKKSHLTLFQLSWPKYLMLLLVIPLVSCDGSTHDVTWSCPTSFWLSWCKEYNGAIDGASSVTCHWHQCLWLQITKKFMLHLIFIVLTWGIQWCNWGYHQCDMPLKSVLTASHDPKSHVSPHLDWLDLRNAVVPLMMLLAAHDTNASLNGITWPECHVAPHFNCFGLRNTVAILTMTVVSCDAKTCANGMHDQKSHVSPQFDNLDPRNVMVLLTMQSVSCDTASCVNGVFWSEKSYCTSFWSSWPRECNGVIYAVISITWC